MTPNFSVKRAAPLRGPSAAYLKNQAYAGRPPR